jgi:homogentisate 1,2-dioxygenase
VPSYHRLGKVPPKRHMVFRQDDGTLYAEELMGNLGFVGPASLLYHLRPPTGFRRVKLLRMLAWEPDPDPLVRHRHFMTSSLPAGSSMCTDRVPLLYNGDVAISFSRPHHDDAFFYRNAQGDEIIFVSDGAGVLESAFGMLPFHKGDYLIIPRGVLHRYHWRPGPIDCLIVESAGAVRTPARYRNEFGQLLEHSPYSERDIRRPEQFTVHDETGEFPTIVKRDNRFVEVVLDHHPFDVVGWDGYYYPWAFNIADFEPRVGRFHLPPPIHQTFEGDGFVLCSFCPRPYDFDPQAIPVPYNHSNVMSDEVIYYASAEFMSRKGIAHGSITLHPDGVPHGPHPGRTEESIGQTHTDELAVMVDSFRPLVVSKNALAIEDKGYYQSWLER